MNFYIFFILLMFFLQFYSLYSIDFSGELEISSAYNTNFSFLSDNEIAENSSLNEADGKVFQHTALGGVNFDFSNFKLNYNFSAKSAPEYNSYFSLNNGAEASYLFEFDGFDTSISLSYDIFADYDEFSSFNSRYQSYGAGLDFFHYQSSRFAGYFSANLNNYKPIDVESYSYLDGNQFLFELGEYFYPFLGYRHFFMVGAGLNLTKFDDIEYEDTSFLMNNQYIEYFLRLKTKFKFDFLNFMLKTKIAEKKYFENDKFADENNVVYEKKRKDRFFLVYGEIKYIFSEYLSFAGFYQYSQNISNIELDGIVNHSFNQHLTGLFLTYSFD